MKKKTGEKHSEQSDSFGNHTKAKTLQHVIQHIPNVERRPKKQHHSVVIYEEGDLRGIVAEASARSIDPYRALFESGVIKNAAEFFDADDR
jgi:hypothetical protein